ncbi:chromodomain protein-3 [Diaporthe helianthi]|uniref:Chromodomain protein-3 n=1 Tax=Diaporthe helianthi TaxID=158607 RepID=A0A2P5HRI5_DIAHE|nr:chromodomain protein-3 [Diaporthe helianthi]
MARRSAGPEVVDDDSDSISLTSDNDPTYDPNTEFVVEDIRAERIDPGNGVLKYLVEWANFPLDECTWEPESEISKALKDSWDEKKAWQDSRVAEEFEQRYEVAFHTVLRERRALHRRRNAKRRRLGLKETKFFFRGNHYSSESEDDTKLSDGASKDSYTNPASAFASDSDSEEAKEDSTIDHKEESRKSASRTKTQVSNRPNKIFSVDPSATGSRQGAGNDKSLLRQRPAATTQTGAAPLQPKARSNSSASTLQREKPSATGYQGSARRASAGTTQTKYVPIGVSSAGSASANPPTSSGPSTIAKKGLTAKKSGKAPIGATNIFIDGKKRQPRQNLASAMIDASKDPRFFTKHHFRRKAELKSRDHDDQAPDVSRVADQLFSINQVPPTRRTSTQTTKHSEDGDDEHDTITVHMTDDVGMAGPRRSSTSASEPKSVLKRFSLELGTDRSKKRAKTVRFTGEDGDPFVSEPVGLEELPGPTNRMRSPPPPAESRTKVSLATYHSRIVQNVEKKIILATGNRSLDVTFHDIPKESSRETDQPWLKEFYGALCLHFGHKVLAESIVAQLSQLRGQDRQAHDVLCHGKITSEDCESVEILAEHLRVSHCGLFTSHENYNLVIYPTRCDGFQTSALGIESPNAPEVALRHFIFRSSHNISRLIRSPSATTDQTVPAAIGKGQKAVFRSLLGMRYGKLIAGPREKKEHHFFLVFPEIAVEWYRTICSWLFVCNSHCKIYTSFDAGSWAAFLERSNSQCGVIVIHETVVDFVRRFPSIAEILRTDNNYNFWRFSATKGLQQAQSSELSSRRLTLDVFSRIFPMGKAILVTPSFLVCEPQKTLQLFEWFFGNQTIYSSNKLVTAFNIVDYLRDLASEANQRHAWLKQRQGTHMSELEAADERNALGLSDQDLIARAKAWSVADEWLSVSMERNGVFSEENHVIFAEKCIDPNDEQSLVNWFGWWSLEKVDQYRKFYVLGSGLPAKQARQTAAGPLLRTSRSVTIPIYDQSAINDPDEALRAVLKKDDEPREDTPTSNDGTKAGQVQTALFQSQRFANNDRNIRFFLREIDRPGQVRIYGFPVSWLDSNMADHFGDPTMEFPTLKQWLSWPFPWLGDIHQTFSTYIALFYTIQEDWDPSRFPKGIKPKRHPWVVVYRPWEPHIKRDKYRHGKTELIFWDVRAGRELENNHSLQLSDLNWMQREVVKFVQAHGTEKNPGSRVHRVWLGGFRSHVKQLHSTLPADMTAEFLESSSDLTQLRWKVPASDNFMRQNGWREVALGQTAAGPGAAAANADAPSRDATEDQDNDDSNRETRILFHPPRGSAVAGPPRSSRCTNDLFEQSRLARLRNSKPTSMVFSFKPTMEWYADLVAEGRQYEHIYVDGWEKVFEQLRVGSHRKSRQAVASSRMSSRSSGQSSPMDESPD